MDATRKTDLNTATAKHLTELPGIPINIARRIVAYRKRHGGVIHNWEELLNVNGFPERRLDEIKAHAVLGFPSRQEEAVQSPFLHHFPGQGKGRKPAK